jgi:cob(I)alamin adenosyltransferase
MTSSAYKQSCAACRRAERETVALMRSRPVAKS